MTTMPAPAPYLTLDDRPGSCERNFSHSLPLGSFEWRRIPFGDVSFYGNGPDGPVEVGVELKKLPDFISSFENGRLPLHQIPGMLALYFQCYLIVQGEWTTNNTGDLCVPRYDPQSKKLRFNPFSWGNRIWSAQGYLSALNSIRILSGVHVITTFDDKETAQAVVALHSWWSKRWNEHSTFSGLPPSVADPNLVQRVGLLGGIRQPPIEERVAAQIHGMGAEKARAAGEFFRTGGLKRMVMACEKEWAMVPGVGKVLAARAVKELNGKGIE